MSSAIRQLNPGWALAAILLAALAGTAMAGAGRYGYLAIAMLAGIVTVLATVDRRGVRVLAALLIAGTFASRYFFDVGGFSVRVEHVVVVVLLPGIFFTGQSRAFIATARTPVFLFLGAYVLWAIFPAITMAETTEKSLANVTWLAFDWLIAVSIATLYRGQRSKLEEHGLTIASVAFAVCLGMWLLGTAGVWTYGLQAEYATGANSLRGIALEANLLATSAAFWLYIAMSNRTAPRRLVYFAASLSAATLLLAYTRASVLALVVGLAIYLTSRASGSKVVIGTRLGAAALVIAAFVALVPAVSGPLVSKLSSGSQLSSGTGELRVESAQTALDDLRAQPIGFLIGLGPNSFGQRHQDNTRPELRLPAYLGVLPLEVLYSQGAIGILLLVGAAFSTRSLSGQGTGRGRGLAAIFFVAALTTSPFWLGFTWVLIALGAVASNDRSGRHIS